MNQEDFNKMIDGLMLSAKNSYDISKIVSGLSHLDLKKMTLASGGAFLSANDLISFMHKNKNEYKFFILLGYDITEDRTVVRFKKTINY